MSDQADSEIRDSNLHELIIGIDSNAENGIYPIGKLDAHIRNVPHVAISIFIFNGQRLLLQKRADTKYHSGGLWANTVCSHPRWDESASDCAGRRLFEELGWTVPLTAFGNIDYEAQVGDLYENEHVHCFFGRLNGSDLPTGFNPNEVSALEWLSIPEILDQIDARAETFSPWFRIYMRDYRSMIDSVVLQ